MEGDPPGTALVPSLREAVDAGLVHKNMQTLVDLTNFTGSVDWSALQSIRKMAPWGEGSENRVAYLIQNNVFAAAVKFIEVLFSGSHHRTFVGPEKAIAWLVPEETNRG